MSALPCLHCVDPQTTHPLDMIRHNATIHTPEAAQHGTVHSNTGHNTVPANTSTVHHTAGNNPAHLSTAQQYVQYVHLEQLNVVQYTTTQATTRYL